MCGKYFTKKIAEHFEKKSHMSVIDNKIPDIFYKIREFQRTSWASVIMHIPWNPLKLEFSLVWKGQTDYRGVEGEKEHEQTESVHCVGQDWNWGGIKPYYIGNWTEKL